MPRYIDADKIIYSWMVDSDGEEHDGVTLQSIIRKIPTADMVEVVRCKECKYFCKVSKYCSDFMTTDEDGFCKWGERREDVTNRHIQRDRGPEDQM